MENVLEKVTLSNGFRIFFEKDSRVKSCSMGVWISSGSGFEAAEVSGASHFVEHMLFKGTAKRSSQEIAEHMDEIGGALNAFTSKEYTCVYAKALSEHTLLAFDIIADMISSPKMDEDDVQLEKGVIIEEIAMYEDSPEDLCNDLFYETVWSKSAFGHNILGSRETVSEMSAEKLRRHMDRFYVPERMVASFCGNFDRDAVLESCEKYFGSLKNTGNPLYPNKYDYTTGICLRQKDFEQNQIILGFPGLNALDDDRNCARLLSSILGASSSSRLFRRIREELGLAYSIDTFHISYLAAGLFGVSMGVSPKSEATAIEETLKIISSAAETITQAELTRACEQSVASFVMGLESTSARTSRNGVTQLLFSKTNSEEMMVEQMRAVTLDDIKRVAKKIIDFDNMSVCAVGNIKDEAFYQGLASGLLR